MDNGAYEGEQLDEFDLLEAMHLLSPNVVVLPDDPGNMLSTLRKSESFLNRLQREKYGAVSTMTVVHAIDGHLRGFELCYKLAKEFSDWIGFSRLTKSFGLPNESRLDRRSKFVYHLQQKGLWSPSHHHHALGMNGYVDELRRLSRLGIESVDSSSPVWRGLLGYSFEDKWPDVPLDMELAGVDRRYLHAELAERNLQEVMEACRGYKSRAVSQLQGAASPGALYNQS